MRSMKSYTWGSARRYNAYSDWFVRTCGGRIQKLSLNAGFTCPNRDGTKGTGGCTYCNNEAFSPSYCTPEISVTSQIEHGISFHEKRYRRSSGYLAYFQAYTNTYGDITVLKSLYGEALSHPAVKGLVIGTRPDCVNDPLLDWLAELGEKHFLMVEYGIESVYDKTLLRINRGHDYNTSVKAVRATAERGILNGAHLIFGLPGETRQEIVESAAIISELPVNSVKIHQLQLIRDTEMTRQYNVSPEDFDLYSLEEYIDLVTAFCERLSPKIMIDRISGEAPPRMLDDPRTWNIRSSEILKIFEMKLESLDTWQGRLYYT